MDLWKIGFVLCLVLIQNVCVNACLFGGSKPEEEPVEYEMELDSQIKCDICTAIAHNIKENFSKLSGDVIAEEKVAAAIESVCKSNFKKYDVSRVGNFDRLIGPGLDTTKHEKSDLKPEKWQKTMREMCQTFMKEKGWKVIYETFLNTPEYVQKSLCHGDDNFADCANAERDRMMYNNHGFMYDDFYMPDEL